MRGIAGEREATWLMEGEKARRQVDVVFGTGQVGRLRQQGIRGGGLTKFVEIRGNRGSTGHLLLNVCWIVLK